MQRGRAAPRQLRANKQMANGEFVKPMGGRALGHRNNLYIEAPIYIYLLSLRSLKLIADVITITSPELL
jgi:hypothetical protein